MSSSNSSEDKKHVSTPEVVLMMSKITEDKLTGPNYLDWSKTIRLYLRSIRMTSHLDKDPPIDDSKDRCLNLPNQTRGLCFKPCFIFYFSHI